MKHVIIRTPAQQILVEVAAKHKIGVEDIKSRHRKSYLVAARIEAAKRLFDETDLSVNQIARAMKRDHSTVSYYLGSEIRARRAVKRRKIDRSYVLRQMGPDESRIVLDLALAEKCTPETIIARIVSEAFRNRPDQIKAEALR